MLSETTNAVVTGQAKVLEAYERAAQRISQVEEADEKRVNADVLHAFTVITGSMAEIRQLPPCSLEEGRADETRHLTVDVDLSLRRQMAGRAMAAVAPILAAAVDAAHGQGRRVRPVRAGAQPR